MQRYRYDGLNALGQTVSGQMSVADLDELEARLDSQRVTLIRAKVVGSLSTSSRGSVTGRELERSAGKSALPKSPRQKKRAISDKDASELLNNMATMVRAGVPFVDSLDALLETAEDEAVLKGIRTVRELIVAGSSMSEALGHASEIFPEMVCDMVRVAEDGGHLDRALYSAATYLERSADLRRKVSNAMMYPLVMLAISGITVMSLILFVLPRFAEVFKTMHAQLPLSTKLMFRLGDFVRSQPIAFCIILTGLIAITIYLCKSDRGRVFIGNVAMKVPKLGDLLRNLAVSRALQSISTLLNSNVSLVEALNHGAKVSGNRQLKRGLESCVAVVIGGGTLAQACADAKVFKPMLLQIIGIGERTGQLGPMLASYGERMEIETDAQLRALVAVLEPLMIAGMGLIVGTIAVSIIGPIYSTVSNVH